MSTPCFQNDVILLMARKFVAVAEIKSDSFDALKPFRLLFRKGRHGSTRSPLSRKVQIPCSIDELSKVPLEASRCVCNNKNICSSIST